MNKRAIIERHNPVLTEISTDSPLSVGNGEFCYTADITGMQTLYAHYENAHFPLCTMSNWGWHTAPASGGRVYEWSDLELTAYEHAGRTVHYPVEKKPGNEEVYDWLRHNPHKFNLGRIGLCLDNCEIPPESLKNIQQKLDLYTGTLTSRFTLEGEDVEVITICDPYSDTIAFKIKSRHPQIGVKLAFPYGNHEISGSNWENPGKHTTAWHD